MSPFPSLSGLNARRPRSTARAGILQGVVRGGPHHPHCRVFRRVAWARVDNHRNTPTHLNECGTRPMREASGFLPQSRMENFKENVIKLRRLYYFMAHGLGGFGAGDEELGKKRGGASAEKVHRIHTPSGVLKSIPYSSEITL